MAEPSARKVADWLVPSVALALAIAVGLFLYFEGGNPMDHLKVITGYLLLILVFFYGLMVLVAIVNKDIKLNALLSESDGTASMSRFQLLIFTFVIALGLFLIICGNPSSGQFPNVPPAILTLLGISATTYAAGKALHPTPSDPSKASNETPAPVDKPKTE